MERGKKRSSYVLPPVVIEDDATHGAGVRLI